MNKALIVGINDYAPVGPGGPDLRGCVNDAKDIANTLSILHVVPAIPVNMKLLLNNAATVRNIVMGLEWLVKDAKPEDLRIFYYSGHGTQVIDGWPVDEPDGRDEAICPHDFQAAGVITDDKMAAIFKNLAPGARLEVILDSCHAGTGTRDPEINVRCVEPPEDQGFFLEQFPSLPRKSKLKDRDLAPANLNHVLWAACKDGQTSQELPIAGVYRGVFTYWFCKVLRKAGAGVIRRILDAQVSLNVKHTVAGQTPQLEAQRTAILKPVFGPTKEVDVLGAHG